MINAGQAETLFSGLDETTRAALESGLAALGTSSPTLFLLAGVERFFAMTLHIALSVLVYTAIRKKRSVYLLLSIGIHALVNGVTVLVNSFAGMYLSELLMILMVLAVVCYARKLYKNLDTNAE